MARSGSWGSTTIAIEHLYLLGGVPQPTLSTFTDPSTTRICSGRVLTDVCSQFQNCEQYFCSVDCSWSTGTCP